jgi:hypothetical protein
VKPQHIKEVRTKEVRQIWKRRAEVWNEKRQLGYIKLDKPIRNGWFKEIIITHKVDRYKNKAAILEVYDKIEKMFWGRTKEEAQRKWEFQTSKYLIYNDFPTISKRQYNKLSFKAQRLCSPFQYLNEGNKLKFRFYLRIPKGAYRIKYTRAYVTHSKRIDPLLESESALLEQQLLKRGYFEANEKQCNWKDYYYLSSHKTEKFKIKSQLKKLKHFVIEDIINESISWEIN